MSKPLGSGGGSTAAADSTQQWQAAHGRRESRSLSFLKRKSVSLLSERRRGKAGSSRAKGRNYVVELPRQRYGRYLSTGAIRNDAILQYSLHSYGRTSYKLESTELRPPAELLPPVRDRRVPVRGRRCRCRIGPGAEQQGRPSPGCYARLVDVVSVLSEYHGVPLLQGVTQIGRRSWRRCRAT